MWKTIKNLTLIITCLYIGAYVGKDNLNLGAKYTIKTAKTCWTWVTDTWDGDEDNGNENIDI